MADKAADLEQKLAALREAFRASLTGRMIEIEDAGQAVRAAASMNDARAAIGTLQDLAHKMVGGAGTFGFDNVSIAAREVEDCCGALVDAVEPPDDEARGRIEGLVRALGRAVTVGLGADGPDADGGEVT